MASFLYILIFLSTSRHFGWKNQDKPQKWHFNLKFSNFSKSFQMFLDGVELVCKCSPGLRTHFPWYYAIFKAFFEIKSKVETCLENAFFVRKLALARKIAWVGRKTRINYNPLLVIRLNPPGYKWVGSLSNISRDGFFILSLLFEKINFLGSHVTDMSKLHWKYI